MFRMIFLESIESVWESDNCCCLKNGRRGNTEYKRNILEVKQKFTFAEITEKNFRHTGSEEKS